MARQLFTNNAQTKLAGGAAAGATILVLTAGAGALFANPTNGDYQLLTLTDGLNHEIIKMTARDNDQITVVRGQESTTARNWPANTTVSARWTAGAAEQAINFETALTTQEPDTGTITLNLSASVYHRVTMGADAELAISNPPSASRMGRFVLQIKPNGYDLSFPASFDWGEAGEPSLGDDFALIEGLSVDGGETWWVTLLGQGFEGEEIEHTLTWSYQTYFTPGLEFSNDNMTVTNPDSTPRGVVAGIDSISGLESWISVGASKYWEVVIDSGSPDFGALWVGVIPDSEVASGLTGSNGGVFLSGVVSGACDLTSLWPPDYSKISSVSPGLQAGTVVGIIAHPEEGFWFYIDGEYVGYVSLVQVDGQGDYVPGYITENTKWWPYVKLSGNITVTLRALLVEIQYQFVDEHEWTVLDS